MIPLFCQALGAQAQPLNVFSGTVLTQWLGLYPNSQLEVCGTVTLDPGNNNIFSIPPG